MAPSDCEICELVLGVSRGVDRLERSIDELLAGVRTLNEKQLSDLSTLAHLQEDMLKQAHRP